MDDPTYITLAELEAHGITREDVLRRCPGAVEMVSLDGTPCWYGADLAALLAEPAGEDTP